MVHNDSLGFQSVMSESLLPDGISDAINATVVFPSGTVETRPTQLWEVIVVISCPVLFVLFLCCCVVCMIIKNYDRPIASSQSPPPLYSDIEKGVIFDPLRSLSSTAPSSPTSPDAPPLTIQYLYPPRYEPPAVHNSHSSTCTDSERSTTAVSHSSDSNRSSSVSDRPSVTVVLMNGSL
ncbi:hypothetical protein COOONC_14494 [Cooperia oncophora]